MPERETELRAARASLRAALRRSGDASDAVDPDAWSAASHRDAAGLRLRRAGCNRLASRLSLTADPSTSSARETWREVSQLIDVRLNEDTSAVVADGGDSQPDSGDDAAATVLEDVAELVSSDRDTHGDAVANQEHIARGWTWYLRGQGLLGDDESLTGGDVGRLMGLLKMSRTAIGDYDVDHDRDLAGYAGIAAACEYSRGNVPDEDLTVSDMGAHE